MSVLIKGMDMPASGVYFLSVDNTGADKTVFTIAEHTRSGKVIPRHVGEAVTVAPHGQLKDAYLLKAEFTGNFRDAYETPLIKAIIDDAPTIIEAEE